MGKRAVLYLRVSTTKQAEKDLSIPDQRRQAKAYCQRKGWNIVGEYVEPGASATDDKRPAFQSMIDDSTTAFDVVIVHSFSRFFRDAYKFEYYRRKLAKNGVEISSLTQELGSDPMDDMVRQILNLFDEYQSKENGKHVLRAMKENTRQGFWNGSQPPYGYRTIAIETRGDTVKKKLETDPNEAKIVKQAFNLYLQGKGIRAIADIFNSKGLRYRRNRRFNSSLIHQMLTRSAYIGTHYFNKTNYKTRQPKPKSEWVPFETPTIVNPGVFEQVQKNLKDRRPTNTPPRVVNGPTLLTGIAKCGCCGGGMTLRTGKGGRYRYYTCNTRVTEGKSACSGRNVPMGKLDDLILDQLEERLFQKDRIGAILHELMQRATKKLDTSHLEEKKMRQELRKVEERIDRLYDAISEGLIEDKDGFRRNLSKQEQQRDELLRQSSALKRRREMPVASLTPKNIEKFADAARQKLRDQDGTFRKQYLRLFVDRVDVLDGEIRISGPKSALLSAVAQMTKPDTGEVPSFVTNWWAHKDSNLGPAD